MGTPRFCSPEQALGKPDVDHRADIYAAGALLYFVLTGRKLFAECAHVIELLRAHAEQPPPIPSAVVAVSTAIDAIVLKALAKEPTHRFQSAAQMIGALRRAQRERPPPPEPVPAQVESVTLARPIARDVPTPNEPNERPLALDHPARPSAEVQRSADPAFDRFRFAIVFCAALFAGGVVLVVVLRWVG